MLDSTTQDQFSIHIMVVLMRNGMNAEIIAAELYNDEISLNRVSEYIYM